MINQNSQEGMINNEQSMTIETKCGIRIEPTPKEEMRVTEQFIMVLASRIEAEMMADSGIHEGDSQQQLEWVAKNHKQYRAAFNEVLEHIENNPRDYEDAVEMARNGDDHVLFGVMKKEIQKIMNIE